MDECGSVEINMGLEENEALIPSHDKEKKEIQEKEEVEKESKPDYWPMVSNYMLQVLPSMLAMMLWKMQETVILVYIRYSNQDSDKADLIAAFGCANMLCMILYLAMMLGFNGSLETLVSQAYGAKDFTMCAVYLHRSRVVLILSSIPCIIALLHIEAPLKLLGQPAAMSETAQSIIKVYLPALFIYGLNDGLRRFFNVMGRSGIPFMMQAAGNVCHVGLCHLLVKEWRMGINGIGLACAIANFIIFVGLNVAQLLIKDTREATMWPNMRALQDLGEYIQLGLPITFMLGFEWTVFQAQILICGTIGVTVQAAQIILLNSYNYFFSLAYGMQSAACTFIGQEIGRGDVKMAREYYRVSKHVATSIVLVSSVILFVTLPHILTSFFAPTPTVYTICLQVLPLTAMSIIFDQFQGYQQGVIKALGIQSKAVSISLVTYGPIFIPLAYLLSITLHIGVGGLWIAMITAMALMTFCFDWIIEGTDWQKMVEESAQRRKNNEKSEK